MMTANVEYGYDDDYQITDLRQRKNENVITSRNFPSSFLQLGNCQELPPSALRTYPWKVYV